MSGYAGVDDDALHALILAENGINAAKSMVDGPSLSECLDCGESITPKRIQALATIGMRCMYCIDCQPKHDKPGGIKMLDRIL
jgi:RNA polymerase-binding transcription factor DksA